MMKSSGWMTIRLLAIAAAALSGPARAQQTTAEVIETLLNEPERIRAAGADGVDFVSEYHDGRAAATALAPFLGFGRNGSGRG